MPDPQVQPVPKENLPKDLQAMFDLGVERTGDATIIAVMAHQPELLRWYFGEFYEGLFYNGHPWVTVDVRTKELLRLKLSKQHGCQFCNRYNSVEAIKAGITEDQIDAIFDTSSPVWDDKDRAVIMLAEQMALQNMDGQLSKDLHTRLARHFEAAQIVELGFIAAILTGVAKWIFTYDIVNREENCPISIPEAAE